MRKPSSSLRAGILAIAGVFAAVPVLAQPAPSRTEQPWPPQWTVTAGIESLWWRDVARTGPPVDGSPVSWEGQGPIVYVAHDRGGRSRLHHFEGSFTAAGSFELRSPVHSFAVGEDGATRLGGRYEYRRYPWRDLVTPGLDAGVGVEASGEHLTFDRHFEPDITLQRSMNNLRTAVVLAVRWQRSERWALQAAWGNGVTLGRSIARYRSDVEVVQRRWGGGWQSTLDLAGDVRVASKARLTAAWFGSGEGRLESHDAQTFGRSRFTFGMSYGR